MGNMNNRNFTICKLAVILFNICNIIAGLFAIGACILYMRQRKAKPEPVLLISRGVLAFIITMSLFMVITAVLGCVGALKKHYRTLYVQVCFYIFLVSVEAIVALGLLLIYSWPGGNDELRLNFYKNGTADEYVGRQISWDRLQVKYHCCGVDGPHDYAIIHRDIPASCCASANPLDEGGARRQLHNNCIKAHTYYMRGCNIAVDDDKYSTEKMIIISATMVFVLKVAVIVLSLSIMKHMLNQRRQLQQNLQAHFES